MTIHNLFEVRLPVNRLKSFFKHNFIFVPMACNQIQHHYLATVEVPIQLFQVNQEWSN